MIFYVGLYYEKYGKRLSIIKISVKLEYFKMIKVRLTVFLKNIITLKSVLNKK